MFDYLQQFNKLPKDLRDRVSSPSAMAAISSLEEQYKVDLAIVIMKVMVKIIPIATLPLYLSEEFSLPSETAQKLAGDLKEKIFASSAEYLGMVQKEAAFDQDKEIEKIIMEAGLILPSSLAVNRFKNIISTYNRGIRNKIDTKNTLGKSYKIGGLDLTPEEIERVLKICDSRLPQNSIKVPVPPVSISPSISISSSRLDKIVSSADSTKRVEEYDLRQAISSGQVKKVSTPEEEAKKISAPKEELSLPSVEPVKALPEVEKVVPLVTPLVVKPVISPVVKPVISPVIKPVIPPVVHPAISAKPEVLPIKPVAPVKPVVSSVIPPIKPIIASRPVVPVSGSKKFMQDVKPMPKVMGPIEELQFLDLLNFRRLGNTPAEITAKIFSKIKLLEAEGYDKMVAGVRAWRQSPVNRLYLKMGQEALKKGVALKDFAASSEKNSENYLKFEEIEAIIGLNSKLVF